MRNGWNLEPPPRATDRAEPGHNVPVGRARAVPSPGYGARRSRRRGADGSAILRADPRASLQVQPPQGDLELKIRGVVQAQLLASNGRNTTDRSILIPPRRWGTSSGVLAISQFPEIVAHFDLSGGLRIELPAAGIDQGVSPKQRRRRSHHQWPHDPQGVFAARTDEGRCPGRATEHRGRGRRLPPAAGHGRSARRLRGAFRQAQEDRGTGMGGGPALGLEMLVMSPITVTRHDHVVDGHPRGHSGAREGP